jgi:serine/threonine protein kinase
MELLEGQNLEHVIEKGQPLALLQKLNIMRQMAVGLHHAHLNGIEGELIGTVPYMAPEQFYGSVPANALSDIRVSGSITDSKYQY